MTVIELTDPVEQPADSKIERRVISPHELLFYVPASGRWGIWLFLAIFWNAIAWTFFFSLVFAIVRRAGNSFSILFASIFPAMGIGFAYVALRHRFATHLLYLGPERVRLQRSLFRKKNFDLSTPAILWVKKAEFYQQNYRPVYGIEIAAERRRIRFGSLLSESEKDWLCREIRDFLRANGTSL